MPPAVSVSVAFLSSCFCSFSHSATHIQPLRPFSTEESVFTQQGFSPLFQQSPLWSRTLNITRFARPCCLFLQRGFMREEQPASTLRDSGTGWRHVTGRQAGRQAGGQAGSWPTLTEATTSRPLLLFFFFFSPMKSSYPVGCCHSTERFGVRVLPTSNKS